MSYVPETPGKDVVFDKPGIPKPAWNDDSSSGSGDTSGTMELIEARTLQESVYSLSINKKPDGTPYKFKAIGVIVDTKKANVSSNIEVTAMNGYDELQTSCIKDALSTSEGKYGYVKIYKEFGKWASVGSVAQIGYTSFIDQITGCAVMDVFSVDAELFPYIDSIQLKATVSGGMIPAETQVHIYGIDY